MDQKFDKEETERRFKVALRGAGIAGSQRKESVTPKQPKLQRKKRRRNTAADERDP
jgi:hypothetical protein